jgi:hypothetical protein
VVLIVVVVSAAASFCGIATVLLNATIAMIVKIAALIVFVCVMGSIIA